MNQVQEGDAVSVSNASVSTAPTSATSLAKSRPAKVQRIDLTEIESEEEVEITYFNEARCVSEVESGNADSHDHELESSSSLWFRMCRDDSVSEHEIRAVGDSSLHEVILDSGADCTVLPLEMFEHVGSPGTHTPTLLDAQGNQIPQSHSREKVLFEIDGTDGETIQFVDNVLLAAVRQPLVCFGKMLKSQWAPMQHGDQWFLQRGDSQFRVHWSKNSLAALMSISKVAEEKLVPLSGECGAHGDGNEPSQDFLGLQMVVGISDHLDIGYAHSNPRLESFR